MVTLKVNWIKPDCCKKWRILLSGTKLDLSGEVVCSQFGRNCPEPCDCGENCACPRTILQCRSVADALKEYFDNLPKHTPWNGPTDMPLEQRLFCQ